MENTNDNKINEQGLVIVNSLLNKPSKETVALIKTALIEGESDAAYTGIVLKKFAKIAEEIKKDEVTSRIIFDATKAYQEGTAKTFNLYGAKITIATRGYWDYSLTIDPYLEEMQKIVKQLEGLIKSRKEEIQNKASAYFSKQSDPLDTIKFGVKPFTLTWDDFPVLEWDEGYGENETMPPIKKGKEGLRYTL